MKNEELKEEALESAATGAAQEPESGNRRSFIKNLAVGTVAAGALAGSVVKAGATKAAQDFNPQYLAAAPRRPTAQLRLTFPKNRPPKLYEVFRAIEAALGPTGCTACGFDGLDFLLRLDTVIGPDPQAWVATLEGEVLKQ